MKFATYRRDSESLLDYAWNRYYDNTTGRFLTPDPYKGSADPYNPQSWNRYGYGLNDPVGNNDPSGMDTCLYPGYYQGEGWVPSSWGPCGGGFSQYNPSYVGPFGGGTPVNYVVTAYSRAGQDESIIAKVLKKLLDDILSASNDCSNWLTGKDYSAAQFIGAIMGSSPQDYTFGYGVVNSVATAAFVGNINPNGAPVPGLPGDSSITINQNGAFFNAGFGNLTFSVGSGRTKYAGGTLQAQAFILLHELAHEVGAPGFLPDAGSSKNEEHNNKLVQQHCGRQVQALQ